MNMSSEQILLGLWSRMISDCVYEDLYAWWLPDVPLGEGNKPPSFEEFVEKLEEFFGEEMSDTLFIKLRDSDYWGNGDYVTPITSINGQFTIGKDYQIKWIDWDDVVYVDDDSGKENGWHVSQWKFVKEGS